MLTFLFDSILSPILNKNKENLKNFVVKSDLSQHFHRILWSSNKLFSTWNSSNNVRFKWNTFYIIDVHFIVFHILNVKQPFSKRELHIRVQLQFHIKLYTQTIFDNTVLIEFKDIFWDNFIVLKLRFYLLWEIIKNRF